MTIPQSISAETVLETNVASGNVAITVPADTTLIMVAISGWIQQGSKTSLVDQLNFDNGATLDFTHIVSENFNDIGFPYSVLSALYMDSGSGDWPGIGAATLYYRFENNTTPLEGCTIQLSYWKGQDAGSPIGDTDSRQEGTDWTTSLTGVRPAQDVGVIVAYDYQFTPQTNIFGQTRIRDSLYNDSGFGHAFELGENNLTVWDDGLFEDIVGIAFVLQGQLVTTSTTTTTSSSSTTTSSSSTSTSSFSTTSTTVPPCPFLGHVYESPHAWTHNESGWSGRTLRYLIPASRLRAYGAAVMVNFKHFGVDYEIGKVYVGHRATSGNEYDFDGNQVKVTFSAADGDTITAPGLWTDSVAFDLNAQKDLIVAVYFVDNGIPRGPLEPDTFSWWKDGDDAATTDASNYSAANNPTAQRCVEVVCVDTDITTTTTTTQSLTTTSSSSSSTLSTTCSSSSSSTQSTTCTTTTSGPYWSWFQDKPVLLVAPNWTAGLDDQMDRPTKISSWYGKEYAFTHYDEAETILQMEFLRQGLEEIRGLYDFFDLSRGRHISFWLPTYQSNILVSAAFDSADLILSVEDFKFNDFFKHKAISQYVFFNWPTGETAIRKILSATDTTITLDAAIGRTTTAEELPRLLVSFLLYGRFDQDEISMEYMSARTAKTKLAFHSLPEETPGRLTSTSTTTTSSSTTSSSSSTGSTESTTSTTMTGDTTSSTSSSSSTSSTTFYYPTISTSSTSTTSSTTASTLSTLSTTTSSLSTTSTTAT